MSKICYDHAVLMSKLVQNVIDTSQCNQFVSICKETIVLPMRQLKFWLRAVPCWITSTLWIVPELLILP